MKKSERVCLWTIIILSFMVPSVATPISSFVSGIGCGICILALITEYTGETQ